MKVIDPDFAKNRTRVADHEGHAVFGPVDGVTKLGIHGTVVGVDFDLCIGDGRCLDACPLSVFDLIDTPGHPLSDKKADPVREDVCVSCLICESTCEAQAIKIALQ